MAAVRKLCERLPLSRQKLVYFNSGALNHTQNFFRNPLPIPSGPEAVLDLVSSIALSNSRSVKGPSKLSDNALLIFILLTSWEFKASGPRNSSMQLARLFLWLSGSLYRDS